MSTVNNMRVVTLATIFPVAPVVLTEPDQGRDYPPNSCINHVEVITETMMLLRVTWILSIIGLCICYGCTSIKSTMVTRDESNQTWCEEELTGVPITLKVPTHVKIYIYERHFLETVNVGGVKRTRRLQLPFVIRDFAQEFIYTEKIFTVDFKRPAAGSYNLRLDMSHDQYIQKVQHDVTDKTIEEVGDLIEAIGPRGILPSPAALPKARLQEIKSVVAVGLFEVDAPDLEVQLTEFINCHLNQTHDAWVVPPAVDEIHRVPLQGHPLDSDVCRGDINSVELPPSSQLPQAEQGLGPRPK